MSALLFAFFAPASPSFALRGPQQELQDQRSGLEEALRPAEGRLLVVVPKEHQPTIHLAINRWREDLPRIYATDFSEARQWLTPESRGSRPIAGVLLVVPGPIPPNELESFLRTIGVPTVLVSEPAPSLALASVISETPRATLRISYAVPNFGDQDEMNRAIGTGLTQLFPRAPIALRQAQGERESGAGLEEPVAIGPETNLDELFAQGAGTLIRPGDPLTEYEIGEVGPDIIQVIRHTLSDATGEPIESIPARLLNSNEALNGFTFIPRITERDQVIRQLNQISLDLAVALHKPEPPSVEIHSGSWTGRLMELDEVRAALSENSNLYLDQGAGRDNLFRLTAVEGDAVGSLTPSVRPLTELRAGLEEDRSRGSSPEAGPKKGGLVLTLGLGQKVFLWGFGHPGETVQVQVVEIKKDYSDASRSRVRIGFQALPEILINREKIWDGILRQVEELGGFSMPKSREFLQSKIRKQTGGGTLALGLNPEQQVIVFDTRQNRVLARILALEIPAEVKLLFNAPHDVRVDRERLYLSKKVKLESPDTGPSTELRTGLEEGRAIEALSPDGKIRAVGQQNGVILQDVETGSILRTLTLPIIGRVEWIQFEGAEKVSALVHALREPRRDQYTWDLASGELVETADQTAFTVGPGLALLESDSAGGLFTGLEELPEGPYAVEVLPLKLAEYARLLAQTPGLKEISFKLVGTGGTKEHAFLLGSESVPMEWAPQFSRILPDLGVTSETADSWKLRVVHQETTPDAQKISVTFAPISPSELGRLYLFHQEVPARPLSGLEEPPRPQEIVEARADASSAELLGAAATREGDSTLAEIAANEQLTAESRLSRAAGSQATGPSAGLRAGLEEGVAAVGQGAVGSRELPLTTWKLIFQPGNAGLALLVPKGGLGEIRVVAGSFDQHQTLVRLRPDLRGVIIPGYEWDDPNRGVQVAQEELGEGAVVVDLILESDPNGVRFQIEEWLTRYPMEAPELDLPLLEWVLEGSAQA